MIGLAGVAARGDVTMATRSGRSTTDRGFAMRGDERIVVPTLLTMENKA